MLNPKGGNKPEASNSLLDPRNAVAQIALDFVLPYAQDPPSIPRQRDPMALIAGKIASYLVSPIRSKFVRPNLKPPAVPEIAVDEHNKTKLGEHDVWLSG